ncbi:MAG: cell division protein FtsA [Rhodobiaceae bacterium]|nr:cell division protein FtsA [Rhodobiaceae bacterium]
MSAKVHRLDLKPMRPLPAGRAAIVTVIDIGSEKICCLIAKLRPSSREREGALHSHDIRIQGIGYHRSAGIKSGVIMDMDAAEGAIRRAVDAAERMSGATVENVIVSVSAGRISSDTFSAEIGIKGSEITENDVHRVLQAGREFSLADGRTVLHSLPIGYVLDEQRGIGDPVGMVGNTLGVDMNVVTADIAPLRNLVLCLERCHLDVEALVAAPYASALGALTPDELRIGTGCIDIGAGTTNVSVFFNGSFVFADAIAIGGHHVTMDLARGLSTSIQHAERIKALHGNALAGGDYDDTHTVTVPRVGSVMDEDIMQVPRSTINGIIRPRVEEILEIMRDRLVKSGAFGVTGRRMVLTGGGSMMTGVVELAERILECRIRIGRPQSVEGLPETAHAPGFSAAIGLLVYPQVAQIEHFEPRKSMAVLRGAGGYFGRIGRWLKESF